LARANSSSKRHHDSGPCYWYDKRQRPVDGHCWAANLPSKIRTIVPCELHLLHCAADDVLGCSIDKLVLRSESRQASVEYRKIDSGARGQNCRQKSMNHGSARDMTLETTMHKIHGRQPNRQRRVSRPVFEVGDGWMRERVWNAKMSRRHLEQRLVSKTLVLSHHHSTRTNKTSASPEHPNRQYSHLW
jgi:hypothetical protein